MTNDFPSLKSIHWLWIILIYLDAFILLYYCVTVLIIAFVILLKGEPATLGEKINIGIAVIWVALHLTIAGTIFLSGEWGAYDCK